MKCKISKTEISSFVGDVLPLWLICDEDISMAETLWSVDHSETVDVYQFTGADNWGLKGTGDPTLPTIKHGVLLTLKQEGRATVTAVLDGESYSCTVSVRQAKKADTSLYPNFYIGDFHDHMTLTHNPAEFATRTTSLSKDYVKAIKDENLLDFSVISDHAGVTNERDFFKGFTDVEEAQPMEPIIFAGAESELSIIEEDRYGLRYKNSGEIVTVNSTAFLNAYSWGEFLTEMEHSPYAVCIIAHPYTSGWSVPGIWNYQFHKNNYPLFKHLVKGVEMGDGSGRGSEMLHEYAFTLALDNGFRVSTTCSSDSHGPTWGYYCLPGKTVIMANEKSKEAFLDALWNRRFYATESGNVKVYYTVNGLPAASDLPLDSTYRFHLELSYFHDDPSTRPVKCEVMSDGGVPVLTLTASPISDMDFTVTSDTAHYFFLRFTDEKGRKTWSAPVWTGRAFTQTYPPATEGYKQIDPAAFTVTELETGADASVLTDEQPENEWFSTLSTASYLIDMKETKQVAALGYYSPYVRVSRLRKAGIDEPTRVSGLISHYRISVSADGESFTPVAEGKVRTYSGEEMIPFTPASVRYVKFEVLSTVGLESGRPERANGTIYMSLLNLFTK